MSKKRLYLYMMLGAGAILMAQYALGMGQAAGPQTASGAQAGGGIGSLPAGQNLALAGH
jgi:hypothetical protein